VGQPKVGDAIRLIKFQGDLRLWLVGEVPCEVEPAWLVASHDGRSAAVVVAMIDHEFGLSLDRTADQLAEPLTEQVDICQALPNSLTRDFDTPSEADADRFIDFEQWHVSERIG
jgi:hypothetical protein